MLMRKVTHRFKRTLFYETVVFVLHHRVIQRGNLGHVADQTGSELVCVIKCVRRLSVARIRT